MENLKRYDIYIDSSSGYLHTKAIEEGDWIKFSDYKEAVERSDNKPSAKCYSIECPAIWHDT